MSIYSKKTGRDNFEGAYGRNRNANMGDDHTKWVLNTGNKFNIWPEEMELKSYGFFDGRCLLEGATGQSTNATVLEAGPFFVPDWCDPAVMAADLACGMMMGQPLNVPSTVIAKPTRSNPTGNSYNVYPNERVDYQYSMIQHLPFLMQPDPSNSTINTITYKTARPATFGNDEFSRGSGFNLYSAVPHGIPIYPHWNRCWISSVDVELSYTIHVGGNLPMFTHAGGSTSAKPIPDSVALSIQVPIQQNNILRICSTPFKAYKQWGNLDSVTDMLIDQTKYVSSDGSVFISTDARDVMFESNQKHPFPTSNAELFGQQQAGFDSTGAQQSVFDQYSLGMFYKDYNITDAFKGVKDTIRYTVVPHKFLGFEPESGTGITYKDLSWSTMSDLTHCMLHELPAGGGVGAFATNTIPTSGTALAMIPARGSMTRNDPFVHRMTEKNNFLIGQHLCAGLLHKMPQGMWVAVEYECTTRRHVHLYSDVQEPHVYTYEPNVPANQYSVTSSTTPGNDSELLWPDVQIN